MKTLGRLLKIIYSKRHHKKLAIPVGFFIMELAVALTLNWQLFGEKYEFNDSPGLQQASIHNPLIVIKAVHSDRLTHPYGTLSDDEAIVHFYSQKSMVKAICFMASLMFAFMGIFISILWIRRYFNKNNLNVIWWQWPIACFGAHIVLYMLANSI